jgi:CHAD domain-containing protein
MTVPGNAGIAPAGSCWFALQTLPRLLAAFTSEISGVEEGVDIEYIHRMRVASRRLRAALPLFKDCFSEKHNEKWMREITRVTRALGEARDADVQIDFLEKSLKKIQKQGIPKTGGIPANRTTGEPAIRFLLLALKKKRDLSQKKVQSAIADLEKSGITGEMQTVFSAMDAGFRAGRKKPCRSAIPARAAFRIRKRISTLLSFGPWVIHPEAVAEHHATRIAAKKLRYTMEVYGPAYRNNLEKPLARVKKIQEILGDVHDCDVWIDQITTLLLRERTLLRSGKKTGRPDTLTLASLKYLLHDRETERKRRYRQFVRYWQALERVQLWDELRTFLDTGRKSSFRPPPSYPEPDAAAAVHALAGFCPELLPHCRTVNGLALMLFDALQTLHGLGKHDRFLLACAAELHDIGWIHGERGHNRSGAEMVFTSESLPFDLEERAILASAILLHRGKNPPGSREYLDLVSEKNRTKCLVLASLLRIADGLDYPHSGAVQEIHCTLSADGVKCTLTGSGTMRVEKERAQGKADLFSEVLGKSMVIG